MRRLIIISFYPPRKWCQLCWTQWTASSSWDWKCSLCRDWYRNRWRPDYQWEAHRGRHGLGGEFGYMTTIEPAERLNNWSQLASTGNMVRYVIEKSGQTDWDGRKGVPRGGSGNALCQEAIERMNRNLAQGLLNINILIDPDVISLGGSISQNSWFYQRRAKAVDAFVERYEEYTIAPVIQACTYQADANLYGALVNWLQEGKPMVSFTGISSKQASFRVAPKSHFSTRCRSGGRSVWPCFHLYQGRMGSINWPTVNLTNSTVPYLCSQQL